MTTLANPSTRSGFDISPFTRAMVIVAGGTMTALCLYAIARALLGLTPQLPHLRYVAVAVHVATALPCVPLGAYLLLARKGTNLHKLLGKVWVALMLATATAALFIHSGGGFNWIHIFVPVTYRACWKIVSTARAGNIKAHEGEIMGLFFGALMIPGIWAFIGEGRLMNVMLLG